MRELLVFAVTKMKSLEFAWKAIWLNARGAFSSLRDVAITFILMFGESRDIKARLYSREICRIRGDCATWPVRVELIRRNYISAVRYNCTFIKLSEFLSANRDFTLIDFGPVSRRLRCFERRSEIIRVLWKFLQNSWNWYPSEHATETIITINICQGTIQQLISWRESSQENDVDTEIAF